MILTFKVGPVIDWFVDIIQDALDRLDLPEGIVAFLLTRGTLHEGIQELVDAVRHRSAKKQILQIKCNII